MKVKQENQDLRDYAKSKKVALWQIAASYGVHEMTIIGRLRKQLSTDERKKFIESVDALSLDGGVQ